MKKPLIFLHIPKTGGWTLHNVLTWVNWREGRTYNVKRSATLEDFGKLPVQEKNKVSVMKGHMPFGAHLLFPNPEQVSYITMLRDPVKRIISSYYYIRKLKTHPLHKKLMEGNYTLKEYVESGVIANTENAQVRMISGKVDLPHGSCTKQILEEAKSNLEKYFSVVGINEYYDESLVMMQKELDWRTPYYLKANVGGHGVKPEDLDQETHDVILKFNTLDLELYQHAKAIFLDKMKSYDGDLSADVEIFRKKNTRAQILIKLKRKIF